MNSDAKALSFPFVFSLSARKIKATWVDVVVVVVSCLWARNGSKIMDELRRRNRFIGKKDKLRWSTKKG